jgi:uncharacterized protein (TIGR02679 family)
LVWNCNRNWRGGKIVAVKPLPPALDPLWKAVHARLSTGHPVSRVRVGPLDEPQRSALADLLGMPRLPGEYATVSLALLDEVLRGAVGAEVRQVVTELVGPIGDAAGDRRRAAAERTELWRWLEEHPVVAAQPALTDWVAAVRQGGLIGGSLARTREELGRTLRVLAELPAAGVPLPVFADTVLGDTHALDEGKRVSTLVLRALAAIYDVDQPAEAQERRALWERAGIADDELSSVVLAAGIRCPGDDAVQRVLEICADAGQAAALTLSQVRASEWAGRAPARVWAFENPSMVALALARFGTRCPPMVCTSGWPSSAGILLLRKLTAAGAEVFYHGDFDGEGLRIAAHVIARTGATPWRMSSADYLGAPADGPPVGRITPAPWDAELAEHLLRRGTTVSEERVSATLLDGLAEYV